MQSSVFVAGTGVSLGTPEPVADAIARGAYTEEWAERSGQLAVTVAEPGQRGPDFAATAGRQALRTAGHDPDEVGLLMHATVYHEGIDAWNAATYVQAGVGARLCVPLGVRMACNGGLISLQVAAEWLAGAALPAALLTTSDTWPSPYFARWTSSHAFPLGDGGSAVVLSRARGFARLLSVRTVSDPDLEGLTRGDEAWGPNQHGPDHPIDLQRRAEEFLTRFDEDELWRRRDEQIRAVVSQAAAEADVDLSQVRHVATPFLGRPLLLREALEPLGLDLDRTTWEYGRRIGHLGAGDQFAGLHHLVDSGRLTSGDHVLMLGFGGGYTWSAAVLHVVARAGQEA